MRKKPLTPREIARRDVAEAIDYYTDEAGLDVVARFSKALRIAYDAIADYPAIGSPRHEAAIGMPGLRSRAVRPFPISFSISSTRKVSKLCAYCMRDAISRRH